MYLSQQNCWLSTWAKKTCQRDLPWNTGAPEYRFLNNSPLYRFDVSFDGQRDLSGICTNKETCQGKICQGKVADVNQQSLNVRWNYSAFMWWMTKLSQRRVFIAILYRGFRERYSPGSMQSKSFLTDGCSNALLINAAMNDWWERKITKCKGRFIMVCTRPWKNGNISPTFLVFSKVIRFPIPNIHVAF